MTEDNRPEPPSTGDERDTLAGFLDFQRATLLWKLEGLDDEQVRRAMVPSGTSLLGIVKHLAYVERSWFQGVWDRQEVSFPWTKEDPDADWRIEPGESTKDILDLYNGECDRSPPGPTGPTRDRVDRVQPATSATPTSSASSSTGPPGNRP